jgi:hypothetical protein
MTSKALNNMIDRAVQLELAKQVVSKFYQLIGKHDGMSFPFWTVFLTFEAPEVPECIFVSYTSMY